MDKTGCLNFFNLQNFSFYQELADMHMPWLKFSDFTGIIIS